MFTAVLFLYLLILTVTKNKHYQDTYFEWVYGQELRYYSVFIVFVLQYVVFLILRQDQFFGKFGKLFLRLSIGFAIMIEISHGVYFCLRAISFKKEFGTKVAADQFLYRSMEFTKKGSMESGNLVVCSNNYTIANMCSLENAPVFYELDKLNDQVKTSAPLTLLIAVDATVPGGLVPFLMHSRVKPDYVFEFVSYYIIHLPKNSNF